MYPKAEGSLAKVARAKPEWLLLNLPRLKGHLITTESTVMPCYHYVILWLPRQKNIGTLLADSTISNGIKLCELVLMVIGNSIMR